MPKKSIDVVTTAKIKVVVYGPPNEHPPCHAHVYFLNAGDEVLKTARFKIVPEHKNEYRVFHFPFKDEAQAEWRLDKNELNEAKQLIEKNLKNVVEAWESLHHGKSKRPKYSHRQF